MTEAWEEDRELWGALGNAVAEDLAEAIADAVDPVVRRYLAEAT
jgi:hypothetical protein